MAKSDVAKPVFITILPAHRGHYVLRTACGDHGEPAEAIKYPVLLWAVEEEFLLPFPVTLQGVQYDGSSILRPDGLVDLPSGDSYPDIAHWFAAQLEEWEVSNNRVATVRKC